MINIFGFAFIIIFTVFAYKTAKDYERNAVGWALITFGVGFAVQIVLPIFIVFVLAVILTVKGNSPGQIQEDIPYITLTIAGIALSFVTGILILRHLSKIPEDKPFDAPPAPPTDFNQNN
jgi:hypothetical protein